MQLVPKLSLEPFDIRPYWMRVLPFALLMLVTLSCSDWPGTSHRNFVAVTGTVFLRDGPPLAGVIVNFREMSGEAVSPVAPERSRLPARETPPLLTWTVTDSTGAYQLYLPEGRWSAWIEGRWDVESGIVGQHVADATFRLPLAKLDLHYLGYRVAGHVVGPGSVPMDDGFLRISTRNGTIQLPVHSSGYELLVPPDTVTVWAYPGTEDGYPHVRYQVLASSDTTLDLSLDGNLVSGHATGIGGLPLYGGWVEADNANASANSTFVMDGGYRMYLPTGEYQFTVYTRGRGNGLHVYPPILINASQTLDFDLPQGASAP